MASEGGGDSRMKSKSAKTKTKTKMKMKMTVEEYLNFVYSDKKPDLTIDHLNQIIGMHGFKRVAKQQKSVIMGAVNSMELIDPARSTVDMDGVSSDALLSIEEVIKDMSELKWQECCITSLETLNAVVYHHQQPLQDSPDSSSGSASSSISSLAEQPKRKRRLRKLRDIINDRGDLGTTPSCSSPLVGEWVTKKRNKRRINVGKIGWGGGGGGKLDDSALAAKVVIENQLWPPSSSPAIPQLV